MLTHENSENLALYSIFLYRDKKRVRGNELFKRQEFDRAVTSYQRFVCPSFNTHNVTVQSSILGDYRCSSLTLKRFVGTVHTLLCRMCLSIPYLRPLYNNKKCDYFEMCAVWYLQHAGEGSKEIQDMEIRCWNNVAAAQLKVAIAVTVNI